MQNAVFAASLALLLQAPARAQDLSEDLPMSSAPQKSPAAPPPAAASSPGKAGIRWITIPGGGFMMSSGPGHSRRREVTVPTFQMAMTPVTNKQYQACVAAEVCSAPKDCGAQMQGDDQPVVCVDWNQARAFSEWAGGRLPSEAEWEYAARSAGKDWEFPWGDERATCERAVVGEGGPGCGRGRTWPVCAKSKGNTAQGLCDMVGNVDEWLQDAWHENFKGAPADGQAWEGPADSTRVGRGGSWSLDYGYTTSRAILTQRRNLEPAAQWDNLGFRPVRRARN